MRKAFGHTAAYWAMAIAIAAILGMFVASIGTIFPAMTVLGPLAIAQCVYWSRRRCGERTTREYLQAEPV